MEKRGQAAMEFLMTYGWAILAAIIAIAVLAYFGVFNPGRYTSETCALSPPFVCTEASTATETGIAGGGVILVVSNGGDDDTTVTNIAITNCNTVGFAPLVGGDVIGSGTDRSFNVPCPNAVLREGGSFRGNIVITYRKISTGDRDLRSTGSITRKSIDA